MTYRVVTKEAAETEVSAGKVARNDISRVGVETNNPVEFQVPSMKEKRPELLSIVIPAYNEAGRIIETIQKVKHYSSQLQRSEQQIELIIVCDGCSDNTAMVAEGALTDAAFECTIISYRKNRGKGYAVKRGIRASRGSIAGFMDADGSTPVSEISAVLHVLKENKSLAGVIGSRRTKDAELTRSQPWHRRIMGNCFSKLTSLLLSMPYKDTQCGFKFFRGELARISFASICSHDFSFDIELLYKIHSRGYQVKEMGVRWHNDRRSTVSPVRDGIRMLLTLVRIKRSYDTAGFGKTVTLQFPGKI